MSESTAKTASKAVNPLRVDLMLPLKTPAGEIGAITFRRGKAKDMVAAQRIEADPARRELLLMAMLTEEKLTVEDMEELDLADLANVQATFQSLFLPGAA